MIFLLEYYANLWERHCVFGNGANGGVLEKNTQLGSVLQATWG